MKTLIKQKGKKKKDVPFLGLPYLEEVACLWSCLSGLPLPCFCCTLGDFGDFGDRGDFGETCNGETDSGSALSEAERWSSLCSFDTKPSLKSIVLVCLRNEGKKKRWKHSHSMVSEWKILRNHCLQAKHFIDWEQNLLHLETSQIQKQHRAMTTLQPDSCPAMTKTLCITHKKTFTNYEKCQEVDMKIRYSQLMHPNMNFFFFFWNSKHEY